MNKSVKVRKLGIRIKLVMAVAILVLIECITLSFVLYNNMKSNLMAAAIDQTEMAADLAADRIDGTMAGTLRDNDLESENYKTIQETLVAMRTKCGMAYLYVLYAEDGVVYYGADADDKEELFAGTEFEDSFEELKPAFEGEYYVQDYIDSSEYGDLITAYVPLKDADGNVTTILGCDYDASAIKERLDAAFTLTIIITIVCFAVTVVLVFILISGIVRNISKVNEKVSLIAENNDLSQEINIKSGDEIELIADNINSMLEAMRLIMNTVMQKAVTLDESSATVSKEVNAAKDSIMNVSATMEEMTSGMQETTEAIVKINRYVDNSWQNTEDIMKEAETAAKMTSSSKDKADDICKEAVETTTLVKEKARALSDVLNARIEESRAVDQISTLTQDIIRITAQTNLLSLNASIEAARAGEAGRGFAIVADEIGKLATDSATAAEKISDVTQQVIEAVEALAQAAGEMLEYLEKTTLVGYDKLVATGTDYQTDIQGIYEMVNRLRNYSEASLENMRNTKTAIDSVTVAVSESAKGVSDVTEVMQELMLGVDSVADTVNENEQIADLLDKEVNRFIL